MRVAFILLAAVLLAAGNAATDTGKSSVSTMASADQITPIDAAAPSGGNAKRFLRSHRTAVREDDADFEDDEERLSDTKIADLVAGKTTALFNKWKARGLTPADIYRKLDVDDFASRYEIYRWYQSFTGQFRRE